jgi:predicted DNA-binding transcriptional regulator AlpA
VTTDSKSKNVSVPLAEAMPDGKGGGQPIPGPLTVFARAWSLALTKHLLTAEEAAGRLGVSLAYFFRMNSSGQLGPRAVKFGEKCSRWRAAELQAWVDAGCPSRELWQAMLNEKK